MRIWDTIIPNTDRWLQEALGTRAAASQHRPDGCGGTRSGVACIPEQEGRGVHDNVAGEGEGLSGDKDSHREVERPEGQTQAETVPSIGGWSRPYIPSPPARVPVVHSTGE